MKAFEIAQVIEKFAPLGLQENWDNSGFCIGDPNADVTKLLIGFDPSYELIEEAVKVGADMVVTHHPLIFSGVKKISGADQTGRAIIEAIKNDIVVYSCHTNMDKVIAGVSGSLAQKLHLKDVQVLDSDENGDGLGVIGSLEQPMDADDFLAYLKNSLSLEHFRYSKPVSGKIERVALCGGSGRSLIKMAYRKGAQIYLCGDISYHDFYCPDHFMVADIGHFESEAQIMRVIYDIVMEKFPNFAVQIANNSTNPVYYY